MSELSAVTAGRKRPFRVMLVDDNRDATDSLAVLARMWGCAVEVAYSGKSVLEKARAFRPDCLLLDIGLPGLDGFTLARRIRAEPALVGIKLVALTAYSSEEYRREAHEAGFDHHLVKPADP